MCLRDNTDDQKLFREKLRGPKEWGAVQALGTHKIPVYAGFVLPVILRSANMYSDNSMVPSSRDKQHIWNNVIEFRVR